MEQKQKPFHFFKGMQKLITSELESRLQQLNKQYALFDENSWSQSVIKRGILVDLSQIRWVEMGAALQLCLLVENAKKSNIIIWIALPFNRLTKSQIKKLKIESENNSSSTKAAIFESQRSQREYARTYLRIIQFERAVLCEHIPEGKVTLLEDYENSQLKEADEELLNAATHNIPEPSKLPEEIGYRFLVPLTWINTKQPITQFSHLEENITRVLSGRERGLDTIDAEAIKNVIISELIKNVSEHSKVQYALIGVVLQPSRVLEPKNYPECEQNYFTWSSSKNTHYISIFFGDTGEGIIKTLKPAYQNAKGDPYSDYDILRWSFEKWSTRKTGELIRGTKGLYRIHRIINKYNGLITFRTKNLIGGYQKGGKPEPAWIQYHSKSKATKLSYFPGTLIRMQFSPFRELAKFDITPYEAASKTTQRQNWKSHTIHINTIDATRVFQNENSLAQIFKDPQINTLIVVEVDTKLLNLPQQQEAMKNVLAYLSEGRHPNGVAVYGFPGGWEVVEATVDSLNNLIQDKKLHPTQDSESKSPDHEHIFDPVLVLGDGQKFGWVGGEKKILDFLTELYQERKTNTSLKNLNSFESLTKEEQTKVLQYLMVDTAYVKMENSQMIRFNFRDLKSYYSARIYSKVEELIAQQSSSVYYVTPNLRNVKHWIDIDQIIREDITGYALALSALLKENIDNLPHNLVNYKILIDNNSLLEITTRFSKWVGIPQTSIVILNDEIDGKLPRRNPIFEKNDRVLIITTIIATKETARRSIKAITRDLANPVAIISLINQYKDSPITFAGVTTPLISLAQEITFEISEEQIASERLSPVYKQPITYLNEIPDDSETTGGAENKTIYNLIKSKKALHFGHFGKTNSRHFTFYLSQKALITPSKDTEDKIFHKFIEQIDDWAGKNNIEDFELWYPKSETKKSGAVSKIAEYLTDYYTQAQRNLTCLYCKEINISHQSISISNYQQPKSKSGNLVVIDWGSITGTTIQQMLTLGTEYGKEKIFICVLFSQLPTFEERFLTNLQTINGYYLKDQPDLLSQPERIAIESKVKIKFIYKLPLQNYESPNCPVCANISSLHQFEMKGEFMSDFRSVRRANLQIKDKNSLAPEPQDFYAYPDTTLDSEIIMEMFHFRHLLQTSLTSTYNRKKIEQYLIRIESDLEEQKKQPLSKLYSVLYFLSVEQAWIQKPPLLFLELRSKITSLAFEIATWNHEEMHKYIPEIPIAIRYKFASITVLRSVNKSLFVSNIHSIFLASTFREHYSSSLTQNLLHHTYSFLKRAYHKHSKHFSRINSEISKIQNLPNLNPELKYILYFLKNLSDKRRADSEIHTQSKIDIIRSLKEKTEAYLGPNQHNYIYESFRQIGPLYVEELINRLGADSGKDQIILQKIKEWQQHLPDKWGEISGYVNSIVYNHLYHIRELFESEAFMRFHIEDLLPLDKSEEITYGYNDEFTQSLHDLVEVPEKIKSNFQRYAVSYKKLYHAVFSSVKFNDNSNSKAIQIANMFPSDAIEIIRESKKTFEQQNHSPMPAIDFAPPIGSCKTFIPKGTLEYAVQHILNNVIKHYDKKTPEEQYKISIAINRQNDVTKIVFKNTGTQNKSKNSQGGLSQIEKELQYFEGNLQCNFSANTSITLTLKNYE